MTRDADLKVLLGREDAEQLLIVLGADYSPLSTHPGETLRRQAMVFVQDSLGARLDLLLADTPYDVSAIERGRDVEIQPGVMIRVCSPEDLVIYKMISTRARDHEDVAGVIRRQANALDHSYVEGWLRQFEQALDDSTLVAEYRRLRSRYGSTKR
ncbi:MAG: hypothetical protein KIS63_15090 [Caldilineales bacterium]|nr:hypothetical protein [Caldilineales bacterium]